MKEKIQSLTSYEKYKLIGLIIKGVTGVVGGSLVLAEGHPYIAMTVLALGAGANEAVNFYKEKEMINNNNKTETETNENISI
jgi:hypothetical protein